MCKRRPIGFMLLRGFLLLTSSCKPRELTLLQVLPFPHLSMGLQQGTWEKWSRIISFSLPARRYSFSLDTLAPGFNAGHSLQAPFFIYWMQRPMLLLPNGWPSLFISLFYTNSSRDFEPSANM